MLPTYLKRPDGALVVNKTKRHVRSFWLQGDPRTLALTAAGTPGDTLLAVPFQVDTQGHFEWAYIMAHAVDSNGVVNSDFTIKIFDPGTRRDLMNEEIHAGTLAGTGRRPGILVETYFLNTENAERQLQISVRNLRALPNNIQITLHGRRWYHKEAPPDVQQMMREKFKNKERTTTYWLTTKNGAFTLAAGAELVNSAAPIIEADDEADSEVFKITAVSTGEFEFRLREIATNRFISNEFVRKENGWGDAEFPFVFQETLLIERNYDVAVDIRDLSGAPNTVYLTTHCRRLWFR